MLTDEQRIQRAVNAINKQVLVKLCYAESPDCDPQYLRAHSISNKRILMSVAENGNLLSVRIGLDRINTGAITEPIGRGKSSTFTGMCKKHDQIFFPIDDQPYTPGNQTQEFLFAYRAAAREYYTKTVQLRGTHHLIGIARGTIEPPADVDLGHVLGNQALISHYEQLASATEEALGVMGEHRQYLNSLAKSKSYHRIQSQTITLNQKCGIAASTGFLPYTDLEGNVINDLLTTNFTRARPLYMTIFPQYNKTYVILSHQARNSRIMGPLVNQIHAQDQERQCVIITNFIIIGCENIFFTPSYWDSLPTSIRQSFLRHFYEDVDSPGTKLIVNDSLDIFAN